MKKDFSKSLLSIFLSYFGPHKKLFLIDMTCAFLVAAIDVIFPLVNRYAMYELLPDNLYTAFFTTMAIMTGAFLLRSVFNFIITYLGHTFGIRVEADIRTDLYRHFQELEFDFYDQNRTGKLMSRLTGELFEINALLKASYPFLSNINESSDIKTAVLVSGNLRFGIWVSALLIAS